MFPHVCLSTGWQPAAAVCTFLIAPPKDTHRGGSASESGRNDRLSVQKTRESIWKRINDNVHLTAIIFFNLNIYCIIYSPVPHNCFSNRIALYLYFA